MAAALGSTKDPKELIPGDVHALTELADTMQHWSDKFDKVGSNLRDVKVPGWHGEASDAFWRSLDGEKGKWYIASDHMAGAAGAIKSYTSVLHWAQGQAADAIEKWDKGDHAGAQQVLGTARTQLEHEAGTLSSKLEKLSGGAKDSPSWLTQARQLAKELGLGQTTVKEDELWQYGNNPADKRKRQWGYQAPNATSEDPDAPKKVSWSVKIAEFSGGSNVWSADAKGETTVGGVKLSGNAGVSLLGYDASAVAGVTDGNLEVKGTASLYLAKAEVGGRAEYGILGLQAQGGALVGANAEAKATIGKDGLHGGAEAFAGAKAEGSAAADVGGVGAGVTGEAWAGAGASASADVGKGDDGKYHVGGEVGVGLGLGGKVGFQVTVDPGEVVDTVGDAADAIGDAAGSAYDHTLGKWF
ncbi:putative T7SS-secreted protein [Streptomyces sp. NPDC047841]|uniref:putative T7SS-secreted protein n=1 Tax=Streptomyces sp. NPDC047841 TaxID=3154708 RepID=UPI003451F6DA